MRGSRPMADRRLTRRTFLKSVAAGVAAGPFVATPARAQGFTWKRFQGKELFLLLTKHPFIDVLEKNIPEFESLSGMKVKWETLPEIQARQKLTVEMTANSGGIDAFFTSLHVEKKRFWKAGWYHPLNKFLQDASLTSPEFDWNDFTDGARAGVAALDLYTRLLRQYAPPGVVNFNWYECSASFMQGQVAIYMDGVNFASQFEDTAKSKVVGKVGYAMLPSGPGGRVSPIYITGMAVSSQSRNKEAAYLFGQWATSKQNMVRELMAGVGVGRSSTWDSSEVKTKPKMPADWYQAYQASLKIGRQGLPEIVGVTEYRDIIGVAIQKAIEGAPAAQVLAQAQKDFQDLLNRTEN